MEARDLPDGGGQTKENGSRAEKLFFSRRMVIRKLTPPLLV